MTAPPNHTTLHTARGEIALRTALPSDAAALRDLRLEALASFPEAFSSDYETSSLETENDWAARLERHVDSDENVIYLAEAGEELVGMTGLFRNMRVKVRHAGMIWGVYVRPAWRGLRVSEALINACLGWARDHRLVIVRLAVILPNAPAFRCYRACGFEVYGLEPKSIYWKDHYYDELLMACNLESNNEEIQS